jgi:hypothetical protein
MSIAAASVIDSASFWSTTNPVTSANNQRTEETVIQIEYVRGELRISLSASGGGLSP